MGDVQPTAIILATTVRGRAHYTALAVDRAWDGQRGLHHHAIPNDRRHQIGLRARTALEDPARGHDGERQLPGRPISAFG
jgi:hypothetical protein